MGFEEKDDDLEMLETFEAEQTDFQREIVIREVSRQPYSVKVIKFLLTNGIAYNREIAKRTGIGQRSVTEIMKRLVKGRVVQRIVYYNMSKRYYRLNPDFPVNEIIKRYNRHIGMKLYKYVPLNRTITDEELKKNPKFRSDCKFYGLSLEEGIELVKNNKRKIESEPITNFPYA